LSHFDDTLQIIDGIHQCMSIDGVRDRLLAYSRRLGLASAMVGIVPSPRLPSAQQLNNVLFSQWPAEWFRRYVEKNYATDDPVVRQAVAEQRAFSWSEANQRFGSAIRAEKVIGDATEFRLHDGFASPLTTVEGSVVLVSLGGEQFDPDPENRGALALITAYAVGRALQLFASESADLPHLTPRETECLKWAAAGKSEWEISQILGISEHTAERHLLNAKTRLGAVNRVQAVAEAIRLGLIR